MKNFSLVSLGDSFKNVEGYHSFRVSRDLQENMREISNLFNLMNVKHGTVEAKLYLSIQELRADKLDFKELIDLIDFKQFQKCLDWHLAKTDNFYFFIKSTNQYTFYIQVSI